METGHAQKQPLLKTKGKKKMAKCWLRFRVGGVTGVRAGRIRGPKVSPSGEGRVSA